MNEMVDTDKDIKTRLNVIFQEVFDDDAIHISEEMTADDIEQWDSLRHITLIVAVEDEFGFKFSSSEIGELENVNDMLNLIAQRLKK